MNTWLISYIVCCIIALIMYVFEIRERGYFSVGMIFEFVLVLFFSPIYIFHFTLDNLSYELWRRK